MSIFGGYATSKIGITKQVNMVTANRAYALRVYTVSGGVPALFIVHPYADIAIITPPAQFLAGFADTTTYAALNGNVGSAAIAYTHIPANAYWPWIIDRVCRDRSTGFLDTAGTLFMTTAAAPTATAGAAPAAGTANTKVDIWCASSGGDWTGDWDNVQPYA